MKLTTSAVAPSWGHFEGAAAMVNGFHWDLPAREADRDYQLMNGRAVTGLFGSTAKLGVFTARMALTPDIASRHIRGRRR